MSLKILNLQLDFGLRAILKKFLIFANFQPPIFIKMIVIKTNGVYFTCPNTDPNTGKNRSSPIFRVLVNSGYSS